MQLENLSDLFQRSIDLAWDCEQHFCDKLPDLAEATDSAQLHRQFVLLQEDCTRQVARLHQVFMKLDRTPVGENSEPIRNIVSDAGKMIGHIERSPLRDAALIFLAAQAEHYRIALYTSACGFARALDRYDLAVILETTLDSAIAASRALTALAENSINTEAAGFHNAAPFAFI